MILIVFLHVKYVFGTNLDFLKFVMHFLKLILMTVFSCQLVLKTCIPFPCFKPFDSKIFLETLGAKFLCCCIFLFIKFFGGKLFLWTMILRSLF